MEEGGEEREGGSRVTWPWRRRRKGMKGEGQQGRESGVETLRAKKLGGEEGGRLGYGNQWLTRASHHHRGWLALPPLPGSGVLCGCRASPKGASAATATRQTLCCQHRGRWSWNIDR